MTNVKFKLLNDLEFIKVSHSKSNSLAEAEQHAADYNYLLSKQDLTDGEIDWLSAIALKNLLNRDLPLAGI